MDFSNWKPSCHALGYIMSKDKGKTNWQKLSDARDARKDTYDKLEACSDKAVKTKERLSAKWNALNDEVNRLVPIADDVVLSQTAKTYLCNVYTNLKFGRYEDIKSKYLKKGLHFEENAITLYSVVKGLHHEKNEEERENDYIKGHIDFPTEDDCIVDTKVNWTIFQFNRVIAKPIDPLYAWQGRGYMWLWNKKRFKLAYCLIDTPKHLLDAEIRKLMYELVGRPEFANDEEREIYGEAIQELIHNHIYDDIPDEDKIRIFELERDESYEEDIKKYVVAARKYLNSIDNKKYEENED